MELNAHQNAPQHAHELESRLRREIARLQIVLDITHLLSSNSDVPRIFPRISARLRRLLHQEFASLALHDDTTGLLQDQAIDFPFGRGLLLREPVRPGDSPYGRALENGTPVIFAKEELGGFEGKFAATLAAEGLQSLCCVPMIRPAGALGVFVLGSTRRNAFQEDDLDVVTQVAAQLATAIENRRAASEIEVLRQKLGDEQESLASAGRRESSFTEIVGESSALTHVLDQAATVASSDATVLILGETGTGKELIARAIHSMSRRRNGPFIKVNCAAIPTGLLESELFGHEKGAFTGAINRKTGRMELADGGTLFLDEIGEIALELQPKLLRVLQDQEFERLGSNRTRKVDLRLVTATNRDLAASIAQRQFRSDLFYRLSVFPIHLPPLRERRGDIPLLVRHFVSKFAPRTERRVDVIPQETMKTLVEWHWPGNIRELENLIERSMILSEGSVLRVPLWELRNHVDSHTPTDCSLDVAERQHIIRILRGTGGVIAGPEGAARRLGLKRTTLQSKMLRLKITRQDYAGKSQ
jgi:formate hydrogenlyase transcriptional activator